MSQDRRTFLKRTGAALSAAAVGGALPADAAARSSAGQEAGLDRDILGALAEVVLPTELDTVAREEAVADFIAWAEGYEPVAELNHGYGTSQIRYGPPDPVPAWAAQLRALDLEAHRRDLGPFARLDTATRRALLESQPLDDGPAMPNPLRTEHVAVALMAHWFRSPAAVDSAYGRRIAERSCGRGIETAPDEPEALR